MARIHQRQDLDRADGQMVEEQEDMKRKRHVNVKDIEEDNRYSSLSYIKDFKTGKDPSWSLDPQLSQAVSSPLFRIDNFEVTEVECQPERSTHPGCHKQAVLSGQGVSFTVSDLDPVVSGPLLESVNSPVELLEGDVEEVWNIGFPIFESSVCHNVIVKLNSDSDQSRQVSENVHGSIIDPNHGCRPTLGGEGTTLDISYEATLPLQVQVKSVVVAVGQHPSSTKQAAGALPKQTKPSLKETGVSVKCVSSARSGRPMVFDSELDLERDKQMYLHSVARHMNENAGGQDVTDVPVTELLNLMTRVADQTQGTNGPQWQHPSDLTRRNYQRRFGNLMPTMALHEWQAKNLINYKRFARVPNFIFS
uniref:S100P-binding protein-like isoform X2 n=1 Tax=Scatophagus argus TaxID=75038 RepID=UPI001ED8579B|nr:S100P-binding protein-like isoform X2 [Scatophagus argus]